jgi:hypothetical protein
MTTIIYVIVTMVGIAILSGCMVYALDVGSLRGWLELPAKRRVVAAIGFAALLIPALALIPLWVGSKVVDFFTGKNIFKD